MLSISAAMVYLPWDMTCPGTQWHIPSTALGPGPLQKVLGQACVHTALGATHPLSAMFCLGNIPRCSGVLSFQHGDAAGECHQLLFGVPSLCTRCRKRPISSRILCSRPIGC